MTGMFNRNKIELISHTIYYILKTIPPFRSRSLYLFSPFHLKPTQRFKKVFD